MDSFFDAWHPSWKDLPWKVWTSPYERFQVLPSFVIGEFFFIFTSLLLLIHAIKHGRVYVMLWFSSLITGTANDAFFMVLPLVDNFWQSQACIMLTPRMPLYIPMVYVVFMYPSLIGAWRFKLPTIAQAALAGLMGEIIYSPYDITGAKFLWWTWHDTDAPIRDRLFGAPIGSSTWVITFSCSFQLIWRLILSDNQVKHGKDSPSALSALLKVFISAATTTPLMMIQMALFQLISGDSQGLPTIRTMLACIITYVVLIYFYSPDKKDNKNLMYQIKHGDNFIKLWLTVYYIYLFLNMLIAVPEDHMSSGVHQIIGDCDIFDNDMAGHRRQVYLCQKDFNEDFNFDCPNFPDFDPKAELPHGTEWYSVCSNPHSNKFQYSLAILALAVMGIFMYRTAFSSRNEDSSKKSE